MDTISLQKAAFFISLFLSTSIGYAQTAAPNGEVHVVGAMKNVKWKGQLYATLDLDTINPKTHLFGLGPVEYLKGEILVLDGAIYQSNVQADSSMIVREVNRVKAPFFAYAHIAFWESKSLPDHITTIPQLENYLEKLSKDPTKPTFFRLTGTFASVSIHVVNLPDGSKVSSPEEAHVGRIDYPLGETIGEILGFFSTAHKTIFTHHDTWLHLHLLTQDKRMMGHVDEVTFKPGSLKIWLPAEN